MTNIAKFTVAQVREALGGDISTANGKMPGPSFALHSDFCATGKKMKDSKACTVCDGCYGTNIERMRPNVDASWRSRTLRVLGVTGIHGTKEDRELWVDAAAFRILARVKLTTNFMRWHDSGDIQNTRHLQMICEVARKTPTVHHWLPTKEAGILKAFIKGGGDVPANLVIRLSGALVDGEPPVKSWPLTSTVHRITDGHGHACPAQMQGNSCGECRACWNPKVKNVSYPFH